jgi:predicted homoserine dehydrogenase-like protein
LIGRWPSASGRAVRVGMIGAGFMGRGIAMQIRQSTPGMELVAICNRRVEEARRAFDEANTEPVVEVSNVTDAEAAIVAGRHIVCEDPDIVCTAGPVDAIIEVTGAIEFGARVTLKAI